MTRIPPVTYPRTEERMAEVKRLTDSGWTVPQIAAEMHVNPRTVTRMRARLGLTDRRYRAPWTPERTAFAESLLDDGWSYTEIARTYGYDANMLSKKFPGRGWTQEQRLEVRELNRKLAAVPDRFAAATAQPAGWTGSRRHLATPSRRRTAAPRTHELAKVG